MTIRGNRTPTLVFNTEECDTDLQTLTFWLSWKRKLKLIDMNTTGCIITAMRLAYLRNLWVTAPQMLSEILWFSVSSVTLELSVVETDNMYLLSVISISSVVYSVKHEDCWDRIIERKIAKCIAFLSTNAIVHTTLKYCNSIGGCK